MPELRTRKGRGKIQSFGHYCCVIDGSCLGSSEVLREPVGQY